MNFDEIVSRVEEWLLDLPTETVANVPRFVNEAIHKAEQKHNFLHMERVLEVTTVTGQRELADFPSDYKAGRSDPWYETNQGAIVEFDWAPSRSDMHRQYGNNSTNDRGSPEFILEVRDEVEGVEELWCYPFPSDQSDYSDGLWRVKIPYWGYTPDLSGAQNNFITRNGDYYCIHFAAARGFWFNRDRENAAIHQQIARQEYRDLKNEDKRAKFKRRNELTVSTGANDPSKTPRLRAGFGNRRYI